MRFETGRLSLADAMIPDDCGRNELLESVDAGFDWERIDAVLAGVHAAPRGRPAYPPLTMLRVLLLQQWFGASDLAIEAMLRDRISFRAFARLGWDDPTPDHSTISRFRAQLARRGLDRAVFAEVARQLDAMGLVVRRGTLVDASALDAQARPPRGQRAAADPDAAWGRKGDEQWFGYKVHAGVDQDSGLIRAAELTPANVSDTAAADMVTPGDEAAVYADKAYDSKARRERLRARGAKDRIMHRPNRHHPELPRWKRRRNKLIAPLRAPVERVFAVLKRGYGYRQASYMSLERNAAELQLKCAAFNLARGARLLAAA